jgi:hypothetical protein
MVELSVRHSEKSLHATLSPSETAQLYADLRYYGHRTINDIVHNMFTRDETPLENFWHSAEDFFADYALVRPLARNLSQTAFSEVIAGGKIPLGIVLSDEERRVLLKPGLLHRKCHCLYYFFESVPAYFAYEVELIALGYPAA